MLDLARQLDEARPHPELGRLPRQVERIERNAVAAEAGPGIERREAERLGLRRLDHFPHVDAHPIERHLQLVDQRDVDRAVDVFEQLTRLGHLGRRHRHDFVDGRRVERDRRVGRFLVHAADDLRNRLGVKLRVARILALG